MSVFYRSEVRLFADGNRTTNRRCQEWTMDYVRKLVAKQYLDASAIDVVHSKRDAPHVGTRLNPVGAGQKGSSDHENSTGE